MRYITDTTSRSLPGLVGLDDTTRQQAISDAQTIYEWVAGHEWASDDDLTAACVAAGIDAARQATAMTVLSKALRVYQMPDAAEPAE